ncbi:MAG: tRNA lysidine(34) synthetase TilS [Candidatus Firestonebacteria bacterium]
MLEKVRAVIKKHAMLSYGDTVIAGVSGGIDSTALLLLLSSLKREYGLKLFAVHINYRLRGAESDGDQVFIEKLCRKLKVPLKVVRADFNRERKPGSVQEAARNFRYMIYSSVAKEHKAARVAVAHNKDDQVETMLMRFLRGSGTEGLAGIPPVRKLFPGVAVIRPLLESTRKEIEKYLKDLRIKPRTDSSNLKEVYLRNKLRLKLIPDIEKNYSPGFKEAASRLLNILNEENNYISSGARKAFAALSEASESAVVFEKKGLLKVHPAILMRIFRLAVEFLKGDLAGIEYKHLETCEGMLKAGRGKMDLPGGLVAEINSGKMYFRVRLGARLETAVIALPGKTAAGTYNFTARILKAPLKYRGGNEACLDLDTLELPLLARTRKPADRFRPLGMKGNKKLQDLFVDAKIPEFERDSVPIITDNSGRIAWVVGLRIDDRFKITPGTKKVLHLKAKPASKKTR